MSTITTHVLDTAQGLPAAGIPVHLHKLTPPAPGPGSGSTPRLAPEAKAGPGAGVPSRGAPHPSADTTADLSAVGSGTTDADGRVAEFTTADLEPGTYQLRFDVAKYAAESGQEFFFPEVTVTFTVTDERHYHVPLLLSPFAYSTYRGS